MLICQKCGKSLDEINFYTYKDGRKTELCKKCLTMHIDNFQPETYLWILQKLDVPYVEDEWNNLRDKAFAKDPYKMNGMSVIGKYLSKMKLRQWNKYGWADNEKIQQELEAKKAEARQARLDAAQEAGEDVDFNARDEELKRQYEAGIIDKSQYETLASTESQQENLDYSQAPGPIGENNAYNEANFIPAADEQDIMNELTQEDKIYLATKWGRLYRPSQWVALERNYTEMMDSFDIHDADTKTVLIHLCKTNLKMNEAIDCGDVDGYQKLSRVYDSLRKSAKFTAAQNKEKEEQTFDCVGVIVSFCEKEGGKIPRYKIPSIDIDKADAAIKNIQNYFKNLIENDSNIAQQIEKYLRQLSINQEQKKDKDAAKSLGQDFVSLTDKDFAEYQKMISEQKDLDDAELEEIE